MVSALVHFLETNAFSEWVLVSPWGFPWLIALHSVGMGIAAGLGSAVVLRATGALLGIPASALPRLFAVAWAGFVLNLVTGFILLVTRVSEYLSDPTFLVKMAAVIVAALCLRRMQAVWQTPQGSKLSGTDEHSLEESRCVPTLKTFAYASITAWAVAVAAGRWIAYLSGMYG